MNPRATRPSSMQTLPESHLARITGGDADCFPPEPDPFPNPFPDPDPFPLPDPFPPNPIPYETAAN